MKSLFFISDKLSYMLRAMPGCLPDSTWPPPTSTSAWPGSKVRRKQGLS
jgi:hypothetical protein